MARVHVPRNRGTCTLGGICLRWVVPLPRIRDVDCWMQPCAAGHLEYLATIRDLRRERRGFLDWLPRPRPADGDLQRPRRRAASSCPSSPPESFRWGTRVCRHVTCRMAHPTKRAAAATASMDLLIPMLIPVVTLLIPVANPRVRFLLIPRLARGLAGLSFHGLLQKHVMPQICGY